MTTLMEAGLVDGEEAATIQSDYVHASCVVTSSTERMSFKIGESEYPPSTSSLSGKERGAVFKALDEVQPCYR